MDPLAMAREWWGGRRVVAVGCALVAAVAVVVAARSGGGADRAARVELIDVRTGERFWFDASARAVAIPARHPSDGVRALVPVEEVDGRAVVSGWAVEGLRRLGVDPAAVDDGTIAVAGAGAGR